MNDHILRHARRNIRCPRIFRQSDGAPLWRRLPAEQQPQYASDRDLQRVLATLRTKDALVSARDTALLTALLSKAGSGRAFVLQMGDCAETLADATPESVRRRIEHIDAAARALSRGLGKATIKIGRMGGQYAKPRSSPVEKRGDATLPVFRGESINAYEFEATVRAPDPLRLLSAYFAARRTHGLIASVHDQSAANSDDVGVFTSHEALHLEFEDALTRRDERGGRFNATGHFIWIGARTHQPDHAHIAYCANLVNPVAVKITPAMTPFQLQEIYRKLNPDHVLGCLTVISRMGYGLVAERLPALIAALDALDAKVLWQCDPMHGNTFATPSGLKTRALTDIVSELDATISTLHTHGKTLAGIHLETSPDDILECVSARENEREIAELGPRYLSKCDPRLNHAQTLAICAWLIARLRPNASA